MIYKKQTSKEGSRVTSNNELISTDLNEPLR